MNSVLSFPFFNRLRKAKQDSSDLKEFIELLPSCMPDRALNKVLHAHCQLTNKYMMLRTLFSRRSPTDQTC